MNVTFQYAHLDSPMPTVAWSGAPDESRSARIREAIAAGDPEFAKVIELVAARADGQIIVRLGQALPAGERGTLLLDFEAYLKRRVDPGLVVWMDALGDKNSLRNLRGIEVKPS